MVETKPGNTTRSNKQITAKSVLLDFFVAAFAGMIVAVAYYFFQNSNHFAPGGVGGLATITYHLLGNKVSWGLLMVLFNAPLFITVSILDNRKLGFDLMVYMCFQALGTELFERLGFQPYCLANNGADFELTFACVATGVISGIGFSIMLRRFGASGGTYAISFIIKHFRHEENVAYTAFLLDGSVVVIAFFVYGMRITPVLCTFINLFIANVVVDRALKGVENGYKFEIVTDNPEELSAEIMEKLGHGVTEIHATGMYSHSEKHLLICIVRKRHIGSMMRIIKKYPGTFACFANVNEVFGRFKK